MPRRMAKINHNGRTKGWWDAEKLAPSSVAECKMKCEMVLPHWKMVWKSEHAVTTQSSNCTLGQLSLSKLCSHENLDADTHSRFISGSQELETT